MNEEMVEEVQKIPEADEVQNNLEKASEEFTLGLRAFKALVRNTRSRKSLARVLVSVIEFPLGKEQPRLLNDNERQLFLIFQELVQSKSIILTHFLQESFKKGEATDGENKE